MQRIQLLRSQLTMKKLIFSTLFTFLLFSLHSQSISELVRLNKWDVLRIERNRFIEDVDLVDALLLNAKNQPESALQLLSSYQSNHKILADSTGYIFYQCKIQTLQKNEDYLKLSKELESMLKLFSNWLSKSDLDGLDNLKQISDQLTAAPRMEVIVNSGFSAALKPDKVGLKRVNAQFGADSLSMVFDTGAGFSCITESAAKRLNINWISEITVDVGGYTGVINKVHLAVCKSFKVGEMEVKNAVFLVFPDKALTFMNGGYVIDGILGFPVIRKMGLVCISKESVSKPSNKSLVNVKWIEATNSDNNFLVMLKYQGETIPVHFDSGDAGLSLSANFYNQFKSSIHGKRKKVVQSSAGGSRKMKYIIADSLIFQAGNTVLTRYSVPVAKSEIHPLGVGVFGNVGLPFFNGTIWLDFENCKAGIPQN